MKYNRKSQSLIHHLLLLLAILLSSGCATLATPDDEIFFNPDDPYEDVNRSVFDFNESVDEYAFKPVAKAYNFIMPSFANKGVSHFFSNIDDIVVFANQLLQLKFHKASATAARFVYNTTFGLLGFIDMAKHMDLPKQNEDFGQTLAEWGVPSGEFIVLPFIGPSTLRNTAGLAVDLTYFDPVINGLTAEENLAVVGIKFIDIRAGLIKAIDIIDKTAPDKYSFMRDAYLERREFLIYDGNPPEEFSDDELFGDDDLL